MDPKLFSAAQQSMAMNNQPNQPNANIMMQFQQQQLSQQGDMQNFNSLAGAGMGFNPANLGVDFNFGQQDFGNLDQTDLNNISPFLQNLGGMNLPQQMQQPIRQNSMPSSVYSPQNMMEFSNSSSNFD